MLATALDLAGEHDAVDADLASVLHR